MKLQSLVLTSDEKILRVLRRVLSDLEIEMVHVTEAEMAIRKLTRVRFEAVIVDCHREETAAHVLRSARTALCNKRAVAVAILENTQATRSAWDLGAHFVLYKPISMERARTSFRAARALMKCERRRNMRIPVEIPVTLIFGANESAKTATSDLSEGGMAVRLPKRPGKPGPVKVRFVLPDTEHEVECAGEVAWQNAGNQGGIRFVDLAAETHNQIKVWLARRSPEFENDDPPVAAKLTDLSLGGCYMELAVPYPLRAQVVLTMQLGALKVQAEGVVRVAHPDVGMGVEFTRNTDEQNQHVEKFLHTLMNSGQAAPDLMVEPQGLELFDPNIAIKSGALDSDDPLLHLFHRGATLSTEEFQQELQKQRGGSAATASA
jgi:c-di-GMP-binding flagellar brake protein YcgR